MRWKARRSATAHLWPSELPSKEDPTTRKPSKNVLDTNRREKILADLVVLGEAAVLSQTVVLDDLPLSDDRRIEDQGMVSERVAKQRKDSFPRGWTGASCPVGAPGAAGAGQGR